MGNYFDYNSGPVNEDIEVRDEAPPQSTPQKKRKREIDDNDLSSEEGIINPETPRYAIIMLYYDDNDLALHYSADFQVQVNFFFFFLIE